MELQKSMIELFETYKHFVYRLALQYTRSIQDAEDISQCAFIKLMENIDRIEAGKEKAWLAKVTVNACKNHVKFSWRRNEVSMESLIEFETADQSEIFEKIMGLQPKYRVVILLYYFEEYSTKEISEILEISQSLVTTRLQRARKILKISIEEEYNERFI